MRRHRDENERPVQQRRSFASFPGSSWPSATASRAPGLAEGPLLNILHSGGEPPANALAQVFATSPTGASKLSSGHRAVADATKPLMGGIQGYYTARANGQNAQADGIAAQVNASTGNVENYSPTAFLVESVCPPSAWMKARSSLA